MRVLLVSLDGEADIPLDRIPTLIGRHPSCDARIDSARISRRHCCLAPMLGGVGVRDLGSTNGTRINGRRIASGRLGPGDELAIAQFRFRLVVDGPEEGSVIPRPVPAPDNGPEPCDDGSGSGLRSLELLPGTIQADPNSPWHLGSE